MVVFATDGAAPYYGLESRFRTLKDYSEARFQEAFRALAHVPGCRFQRLTKPDGSYFVDQHLFRELRSALRSLCQIARAFSPDALLSHAYEGGHIDHDACSFLAMHAASELSLPRFEFPLYSVNKNGHGIFQQFRDIGSIPMEWRLTDTEIDCKKEMLAEYKTQPGLVSVFQCTTERIRATSTEDFSVPQCRDYSYRDWRTRFSLATFFSNRHTRISSSALLKEFAEFKISRNVR